MSCHISFRSVTFIDHLNTVTVTVITDVPCILHARTTSEEPRIHKESVTKRGISFKTDIRFCFTVFEDEDEDTPGESTTHIFTKPDWAFCQTKWLYFWGSIAGETCVSTSPFFKHHNSYIVPPPVTFTRRVAAGTDDAQKGKYLGNWFFGTAYGYNEAGHHANSYGVMGCGMRFLNIAIPPGSVITVAKLTFRCYTASSFGVTRSKLRGQKSLAPATFSTLVDFNTRPFTTAVVLWDNIPPWTVNILYDSIDFSPVIQEIISQPGWASGNPIVCFWDDWDFRSQAGARHAAQSYDSAPLEAPLITLAWLPP